MKLQKRKLARTRNRAAGKTVLPKTVTYLPSLPYAKQPLFPTCTLIGN